MRLRLYRLHLGVWWLWPFWRRNGGRGLWVRRRHFFGSQQLFFDFGPIEGIAAWI